MIEREDFPLSTVLYYKIGGTARLFLEATGRDDVYRALEVVARRQLGRLVVVGLGSNLLFPDGVFEGAVLQIAAPGTPQIRLAGPGRVEAFAGVSLDDVVAFGFEHGLAGLEWAGGLPGTVGAAVRGNVGAFGGELKDVLASAEVLDTADSAPSPRALANSDLAFSYRDSAVKRSGGQLVVLGATFQLAEVSGAALAQARVAYQRNIDYRWTNHPMEYPTCGSVFKNVARREDVERVLAVWPDAEPMVRGRWHGKVSMGYAIDRLGLAGFRVGNAQVSPKHRNFIVNLGGARFADVEAIIAEVQDRFSRTFGFVPEPEVEVVRL
jgi:UDP-N-acetylmuramate dehydrogenase